MLWSVSRVNALIGLLTVIFSIVIDSCFSGEGTIKPEGVKKVLIYMPSIVLHCLGLIEHSVSDVIAWMYLNIDKYFYLVLFLTFSEIVGGLIDSAIALIRYYARNGLIGLSIQKRYRIIKFGDDNRIIKGEGRYDLSLKHLFYGFFSNITGALCPLSMLIFIRSLPDFLDFLQKTKWLDFTALCAPFTVVPSLQQISAELSKPYPSDLDSPNINPDNYLLNRFHAIALSVCLWFTITMVVIFGLVFSVYSIINFRHYKLSISFVLPILALTVYLWYQSCSSVSIIYQAVNTNAYKMGRVIIALIVLSVTVLFRFSLSMLGVIILCAFSLCFWGWMIRKINERTRKEKDWQKNTRWIIWSPILILFAVVVMIIIQVVFQKPI